MAGDLRLKYQQVGRTAPGTDTVMAAQALSRDATLIMDNVRDFGRCQN